MAKFEDLLGQTLMSIKGGIGDDEMLFITVDGKKYKFYHEQRCCETVVIEDIVGDIKDLLGSPILLAESIEQDKDDIEFNYSDSSAMWTFYKLSTIKGTVTIRWLGESNGYYSEEVDFIELGGIS